MRLRAKALLDTLKGSTGASSRGIVRFNREPAQGTVSPLRIRGMTATRFNLLVLENMK